MVTPTPLAPLAMGGTRISRDSAFPPGVAARLLTPGNYCLSGRSHYRRNPYYRCRLQSVSRSLNPPRAHADTEGRGQASHRSPRTGGKSAYAVAVAWSGEPGRDRTLRPAGRGYPTRQRTIEPHAPLSPFVAVPNAVA